MFLAFLPMLTLELSVLSRVVLPQLRRGCSTPDLFKNEVAGGGSSAKAYKQEHNPQQVKAEGHWKGRGANIMHCSDRTPQLRSKLRNRRCSSYISQRASAKTLTDNIPNRYSTSTQDCAASHLVGLVCKEAWGCRVLTPSRQSWELVIVDRHEVARDCRVE